MSEIETIWLKNLTNGLIYEIPKTELSIYQTDQTKVAIATEAEIKKWKDGTYWANVNDVEVKPVSSTTEPSTTEPSKK